MVPSGHHQFIQKERVADSAAVGHRASLPDDALSPHPSTAEPPLRLLHAVSCCGAAGASPVRYQFRQSEGYKANHGNGARQRLLRERDERRLSRRDGRETQHPQCAAPGRRRVH
ncbi:hypothetical protein PC129_g7152 [Phytophthora cactorum]|uniref:Uncharacterized protein n=1 Tax=Phytophthora cactorum TaxID=29920 RepID=A0A8T1KY85_9STRA|nr:hypothetical protein PC112_g8951 [Phytophthora cactorum]KAG2828843.1 hypothetical protein PC111_g8006 [Phytophthora cactorum]KAG3222139.1 hypothetical protein PC129_g7152 [Phytophthora cactorum]KAG4239561.1 hypothetical protein PC116_g12426 [Phytophthora cactorum]